jgi:hypothetical protein
VRQLKFGLNARNIDEFTELVDAKLPNISFFTIPGILLDSSAKLKKSSHKNSKKLQVLDIVEPEFAALVPEESLQVRIEFFKIFASRCAQAARLGISTVSANFDLTRAVNNPTYEILLSKILKACSGILDQHQLTLTIPVRIPSKDISLASAVKFIRSILCYNIQLTILLYPHEPNALEHDEEFYNNLKYNLDSWRICFEPEFGNMLTPTLLNKIFSFPFTPLPQPDSEVLLYIGKDTVDIDFYRELATLIKDVKISNLPPIVTP